MRRFSLFTGCAALALAAGTVHGQLKTERDAKVNADGDVQLEHIAPSAPETIWTFGAAAGQAPATDLLASFVALGSNPEADDHAAAAFLPDGSGVVWQIAGARIWWC